MTAPTTKAAAQTLLDSWYDALEAVSTGHSYSIGGRTLERVDTSLILQTISRLQRMVDDFTDAARVTPPRGLPGVTIATWSGTTT